MILGTYFVLLFLTATGVVVQHTMAQGQSANKSEIIVAKTPGEKANLERFDKLDFEGWNNRNWTL